MKVIQVVDGYKIGDGVGNVVKSFDDVLNSNGYETAIISRGLVRADINNKIFDNAVVFFHFSFLYEPIIEHLKCKKVLVFHNITNTELFNDFNDRSRICCGSGWHELKRSARYFDYAIVFSEYSKRCLIENGWRADDIFTLPIRVMLRYFAVEPNKGVVEKYSGSGTNILFTGRVNPNKKQEDLICVLAAYKRKYDSDARLFIVGGCARDAYFKYLMKCIEKLDLADSVVFTGHVSMEDYVSYFKISDLFLCMSEHEGFCIPLVEAMHFGIPIIAYDSTAVPDTLAGCGILVDNKEPEYIADQIYCLLSDKEKVRDIIIGEKERLKAISEVNIEEQYKKVFEHIINSQLKKNNAILDEIVIEGSSICTDQFENGDRIVIYGAGSSGSKLYQQLINDEKEFGLLFCDREKAGSIEKESGARIISYDELINRKDNSNIIIAIQDKKTVKSIAYKLMDDGVSKEKIYCYDSIFNTIF